MIIPAMPTTVNNDIANKAITKMLEHNINKSTIRPDITKHLFIPTFFLANFFIVFLANFAIKTTEVGIPQSRAAKRGTRRAQ